MSMFGSPIRDAVYDYDIQRADGFVVVQLAVVNLALRWVVRCGDAQEIVTITFLSSASIPREALNRTIKFALQDAVDRMWSRWEAL